MSTANPQHSASIYKKPLRHHHGSKKVESTTSTVADSFPAIPTNKSTEKVNALRNELYDAHSEIELMQAKLRNLQALKEKHQARHEKNLSKIQFMNQVKERNRKAFEHKQKLQQQREEEAERLRNQAEYLREMHLREKNNAESYLFTIKASEACQERKRHKDHEQLLSRLKEMEARENSLKAERIKKFHELSSSRMKDYHESRVNCSKDNYKQKLNQTKQQKQRARSMLEKLKEEEERLMRDVKTSQQAMLGSLYGLESLNNVRKRKKFSSLSKFNQYDADEYSQDEFQS